MFLKTPVIGIQKYKTEREYAMGKPKVKSKFNKKNIKKTAGDAKNLAIKTVKIAVGVYLLITVFIGLPLSTMFYHVDRLRDGISVLDFYHLEDIIRINTWVLSFIVLLVGPIVHYAVTPHGKRAKKVLGGAAEGIDSPLENSRFLTDEELSP